MRLEELIAFNGIAEILPFTIPIIIFLIPIVAILTSHQRKMAEIYQNKNTQADPNLMHEMHQIKAELAQLRQLVGDQTIALDNLQSRQANLPEHLSSRVGEE